MKTNELLDFLHSAFGMAVASYYNGINPSRLSFEQM